MSIQINNTLNIKRIVIFTYNIFIIGIVKTLSNVTLSLSIL